MPLLDTKLPGVKIFEPKVWEDERGYFYESYNFKTFAEGGIDQHFVQDNQARSQFGVIRGLHYQVAPFAQAKLVRVIRGAVLDVVVDIRPESPTFGQWLSVELSDTNKRQLFVPRGFAHGYAVLTSEAEFFYKVDNYYSKAHEGGIIFNDPQLNIDWQIPAAKSVISDKDKKLPLLGEHRIKASV